MSHRNICVRFGDNSRTITFQRRLFVIVISSLIGLSTLVLDIFFDFLVLNEPSFIDFLLMEIYSGLIITRRLWVLIIPVLGLILDHLIISRRFGIQIREQKLLDLLETSEEIIIFTTPDYKILQVNPYFFRLLGYQEDHLGEIKFSDFFPKFDEIIQERGGEYNWKTRSGENLIMNVRITDKGENEEKIIFAHDITEKREVEQSLKRTQNELLRSQKMEIVGRFINGVIHDFNNLLQIIDGHIQLIQQNSEGAELRFNTIREAINQSKGLIDQLLLFSKSNKDLNQEIINVNQIIDDTRTLIQNIDRSNIKLSFNQTDKPIYIKVNLSQINQVLLNLIINAVEAMPEGGSIEITTQQDRSQQNGTEYALISVSDTGQGMDSETLDQLFEPFFTTKPNGTGLGLFTVYSIIKQNQGKISVESEMGHGTTFRIYLPTAARI